LRVVGIAYPVRTLEGARITQVEPAGSSLQEVRAGALEATQPPSAPGEEPAGSLIGGKVLRARNRHQFGQTVTGPVDAAFDGADRATANLGRFLVREAGRPDEHQRFALIVGQLGERLTKLVKLDLADLLRLDLEPF